MIKQDYNEDYYGFRYSVEKDTVKDNETKKSINEISEVVDLLNKLYEEKIQLEKDLTETKAILLILEDENKQLKQYHTDDLRHIQYLQLRLKE